MNDSIDGNGLVVSLLFFRNVPRLLKSATDLPKQNALMDAVVKSQLKMNAFVAERRVSTIVWKTLLRMRITYFKYENEHLGI